MFSYLRKPTLSSVASVDTSFSSDNSYVHPVPRTTPLVLRQLAVHDLDQLSSNNFQGQHPNDRELFRIPRPVLKIPRPLIHLPANDSLWLPYVRPTRVQESSSSSSPTCTIPPSDRPLYQNLPVFVPSTPPPPPLPPPLPLVPFRYQVFNRPGPQFIEIQPPIQKSAKKNSRVTPAGFFTTLCTGGFSTVVALLYLVFILALPIIKLVLGILYMAECPINRQIPIYMIVSGACGIAAIVTFLLSSACTFTRSLIRARKSTHAFMLGSVAFARGFQGAITIFLFFWFFFGNIWVFGVRYRVRTNDSTNLNNYCHPTLYWFAFYVLIFTYVQAFLAFCMKFCVNFFCCGACDIWQKAFS